MTHGSMCEACCATAARHARGRSRARFARAHHDGIQTSAQIVDTILSSTTRLVANRDAWADGWKRRKIEDLALLLQGALEARNKVGLKMNLHKDRLDSVRPATQAACHTVFPSGRYDIANAYRPCILSCYPTHMCMTIAGT